MQGGTLGARLGSLSFIIFIILWLLGIHFIRTVLRSVVCVCGGGRGVDGGMSRISV